MKTSLKVNARPYFFFFFFALGVTGGNGLKWPFVATKHAGSAGPGQSLHLHAKEDQHNFLVLKSPKIAQTGFLHLHQIIHDV